MRSLGCLGGPICASMSSSAQRTRLSYDVKGAASAVFLWRVIPATSGLVTGQRTGWYINCAPKPEGFVTSKKFLADPTLRCLALLDFDMLFRDYKRLRNHPGVPLVDGCLEIVISACAQDESEP